MFKLIFIYFSLFNLFPNENSILDKKWILVELNKKKITRSEKNYIELNKKSKTISIFAGCNSMGSDFTLKEKELQIGMIHSTMMACENMDLEQKLALVMEKVKTYSIETNTLNLFDKNKKVLAKFN